MHIVVVKSSENSGNHQLRALFSARRSRTRRVRKKASNKAMLEIQSLPEIAENY